SDLGFAQKQVDMFRHDDKPYHHKAVSFAGLLQHGKQTVAAPRRAQKWEAPIARTRDKVQLIGAVVAMQAARHDQENAISSIAAHPCKKRKDGAPAFHYGKEERQVSKRLGHPKHVLGRLGARHRVESTYHRAGTSRRTHTPKIAPASAGMQAR